jgi:hypothetical protein
MNEKVLSCLCWNELKAKVKDRVLFRTLCARFAL